MSQARIYCSEQFYSRNTDSKASDRQGLGCGPDCSGGDLDHSLNFLLKNFCFGLLLVFFPQIHALIFALLIFLVLSWKLKSECCLKIFHLFIFSSIFNNFSNCCHLLSTFILLLLELRPHAEGLCRRIQPSFVFSDEQCSCYKCLSSQAFRKYIMKTGSDWGKLETK